MILKDHLDVTSLPYRGRTLRAQEQRVLLCFYMARPEPSPDSKQSAPEHDPASQPASRASPVIARPGSMKLSPRELTTDRMSRFCVAACL